MKKIKLIGAGQLGSRHLQALKTVEFPLEIEVIDPSVESLQIAQERYEAVGVQNCRHQIVFNQKAESQGLVDIAIIATASGQRRAAIEMILSTSSVKHFVLEKLLFDQLEDYDWMSETLLANGSKAWVNCCMRMMPFYQQLRENFKDQVISYQVTGSQYGLVTNAIHYLDHMAYVTNCNTFTVDTSYLDSQPIPSKRRGYLELNGMLLARFQNNSVIAIHCNPRGDLPVQVEIVSDMHRVISKEWQQKAWLASNASNWTWQEVDAKIPYQSQMTAQLVTELLTSDHCALTSYEESKKTHLQLLKPLQQLLQTTSYPTEVNYPFT